MNLVNQTHIHPSSWNKENTLKQIVWVVPATISRLPWNLKYFQIFHSKVFNQELFSIPADNMVFEVEAHEASPPGQLNLPVCCSFLWASGQVKDFFVCQERFKNYLGAQRMPVPVFVNIKTKRRSTMTKKIVYANNNSPFSQQNTYFYATTNQ